MAVAVRWSYLTLSSLTAGVLGLAACTSAGDAEMPEFAPRDATAAIEAVSLGSTDSKLFDHRRAGTRFPEGTRRVAVWYRWEGAGAGLRIDNRWYLDATLVLTQGEIADGATGRAAWFLTMADGTPLTPGNYRVDLLENGVVVTSIPFRIGS